jgi:DNA-binding GntR family transcriptional regulator
MVERVESGFVPAIPVELPRGGVADAVFASLCAAIADGSLTSGMYVHEGAIAKALGISRTPVREAVQRLRSLGLIDAQPGHHTRVAFVTPERTAQALSVFVSLFRSVCLEVAPRADASVTVPMRAALDAFGAARDAADDDGMAVANFGFYDAGLRASRNPVLQSAIAHVVYLIRLGGLQLPARIDVDAVHDALRGVLRGFEGRDAGIAVGALDLLVELEIPR